MNLQRFTSGMVVALCVVVTQPICFAQDESRFDKPANETIPKYDDPKKERLYQSVLTRLQKMEFAEDSAFADEATNPDVDWFVVGGMLSNRQSGAFQANFATYQGVENVAQRIVDFEHGSFGSNKPAWRVYHRYGGSREAERAKEQVETDFNAYLAKLQQDMIRRQQVAARARARAQSRSRRGSGNC